MDKMWPSFLKDGDTLREAAALFIKSVPETKTNSRLLVCQSCWDGGSQFHDSHFRDEFPFAKSITTKLRPFMLMLEKYLWALSG